MHNPIEGMCPHHFAIEENWAVANRIFCDWLHRRIELSRLAQAERGGDDDFWAHTGEAS
jgi:hypothetical protein